MRNLLDVLLFEKANQVSGGIYNKMQVDFAYNSNHIEGSQLTHDQTRYIYETHSVVETSARVNDILETVNHFRCFDYILERINEPLTADFIKDLHFILKNGVIIGNDMEAVIGDYKVVNNFVGNIATAAPADVAREIDNLLGDYEGLEEASFYDILAFHADFEKIHPFYDGNGRVGRLLMLKECLRHDIVPFYIIDEQKVFYYRGLYEWQTGGEKGYLIDTCRFMQDNMKQTLDYFKIDYRDDEKLEFPKPKKNSDPPPFGDR